MFSSKFFLKLIFQHYFIPGKGSSKSSLASTDNSEQHRSSGGGGVGGTASSTNQTGGSSRTKKSILKKSERAVASAYNCSSADPETENLLPPQVCSACRNSFSANLFECVPCREALLTTLSLSTIMKKGFW